MPGDRGDSEGKAPFDPKEAVIAMIEHQHPSEGHGGDDRSRHPPHGADDAYQGQTEQPDARSVV